MHTHDNKLSTKLFPQIKPPKPAEEDKNDEEGKEGESPRTREQSIETEQAAPPPPPGPPTNEEQQEQPQAVAQPPVPPNLQVSTCTCTMCTYLYTIRSGHTQCTVYITTYTCTCPCAV